MFLIFLPLISLLFFEFMELDCFESIRNSMLESINLQRFVICCQYMESVLSKLAKWRELMEVQNTFWQICIQTNIFTFHGLVLSIDNNTFPGRDWYIESFVSSVIDEGILIGLFNSRNGWKLCSAFPVVFHQICWAHCLEGMRVSIVQNH